MAIALCGFFCPQVQARATTGAPADVVDDGCPGEMTLLDNIDAGGVDADGDNNAALEAVEVIVPCALVDSGALGADCHDAAFYVVNQTGTLLCRVDVAVFANQPKSTSIETGTPAAPTSTSSAVAAAVPSSALHFQLYRQRMIELPCARGPSSLGPGLDLTSFSPRPS